MLLVGPPLSFRLKYGNYYWMDQCGSLYRCSRSSRSYGVKKMSLKLSGWTLLNKTKNSVNVLLTNTWFCLCLQHPPPPDSVMNTSERTISCCIVHKAKLQNSADILHSSCLKMALLIVGILLLFNWKWIVIKVDPHTSFLANGTTMCECFTSKLGLGD